MPARDLTAEDVADWLTPRQALAILDEVFKETDLSKAELLERLRGGMVRAISIHVSIDGQVRAGTVTEISADDWRKIWGSDTVWVTGTLSVEIMERGSYGSSQLRYFDVRFEPQGIHAIVGLAAIRTNAKPEAPTEPPEPEPKGPRVSDAHLQAWFEFYKKVHGEVEDTEDRALESARKNFPGKSVSRERVRTLRGSQRRGPKRKVE